MPKYCLFCTHLNFDLGTPDYSDLTPGDPVDISCQKDHWRMRRDDDREDYRRYMQMAAQCVDYEKVR